LTQRVAAMFGSQSKLLHGAPCGICPQLPAPSFQIFYLDVVQAFLLPLLDNIWAF